VSNPTPSHGKPAAHMIIFPHRELGTPLSTLPTSVALDSSIAGAFRLSEHLGLRVASGDRELRRLVLVIPLLDDL
jgi:hypothetical protein